MSWPGADYQKHVLTKRGRTCLKLSKGGSTGTWSRWLTENKGRRGRPASAWACHSAEGKVAAACRPEAHSNAGTQVQQQRQL